MIQICQVKTFKVKYCRLDNGPNRLPDAERRKPLAKTKRLLMSGTTSPAVLSSPLNLLWVRLLSFIRITSKADDEGGKYDELKEVSEEYIC